jgi:hypothetical protein
VSSLKPRTKDDAPQPTVSPLRELRGQEAQEHKMVATAQLRARQAKGKMMPKKPKRKPRGTDRRNVANLPLIKLSDNNCEHYGASKVDILRLREVPYGAR